MKLRVDQLDSALNRQLLPLYLIFGDEPLQVGECADKIRQSARDKGFLSREVFFADNSFNWQELSFATDSMSLFAEQRILDLKLEKESIGRDGAALIREYAQNPAPDTILLISAGKLASGTVRSAWYKEVEKTGAVIQVWPLQAGRLLDWIDRRARARGLVFDDESVRFLAHRVEGNLLAAAQEIEKLIVLHGEKALSINDVMASVSDHSRFDVFELMDAAVAGKPNRGLRILNNLIDEGIAEPVILWALAREIRLLIALQQDKQAGLAGESLYKRHKVWERRQALIERALARCSLTTLQALQLLCAKADRTIKGCEVGDARHLLEDLVLTLAGADMLSTH